MGKNMEDVDIEKVEINEYEQEMYAAKFAKISISTGMDPGKEVYNWIKNTDYCVVARVEKRIIGFMCYTFLGGNVIYMSSAMLRPEYQKKKIGSRMMRCIIRDFLRFRLRNILKHPTYILRDIHIFFRTQNPLLYAMLARKMEVFPSTNKVMNISHEVIVWVTEYSKKCWPLARLDKKELVLVDAYKETPLLAYNIADIPWSRDKKIDAFFRRKLGLDTKSYKAMVVIARLKLFHCLRLL